MFPKNLIIVFNVFCILFWHSVTLCQGDHFSYSKYLFGNLSTLSIEVVSIDTATGLVQVNGVDLQSPRTPFTWEWGDGTATSGFFPQTHAYSNRSNNYFATVVAHYTSGSSDSAQTLVRFVPPVINPVSLPSLTSVIVPSNSVTLQTHWSAYTPPSLQYFSDGFFPVTPRSSVEYLLSIAAFIEMDLVNDDVFMPNGNFQQVVLRDSSAGGAYSIWFSTPVSLGAGDAMFEGTPSYSSLFHEMGHNFTLNFPAKFPYGGRIDGNANAIYSETMAQIFQHAAGYELVNNAASYGLGPDLVFEIEKSLISSIQIVRQACDSYVAGGCHFASWNNPSTSTDETFNTFMTLAYEFCAQAESLNAGYSEPVKRLTNVLAQFDSTMWQAYDQSDNTAAADSFRATLMVSALSYAFNKDLRTEFIKLNFPINDNWFNQFVDYVKVDRATVPSKFKLSQNYPNPFNPNTVISYQLPVNGLVTLKVYDVLGREVAALVNEKQNPGYHAAKFNAADLPSGVYFYRLEVGTYSNTMKLLLLK